MHPVIILLDYRIHAKIAHTLRDYRYVTLRLKARIRHVTCDVT